MSLEAYSSKRLLVVDEIDSYRFTIKKMLRSLGMTHVDTAGTGQEVIRNCKQRHYDVILCGYDLGSGRNGQEVLEEIRQNKMMKSSGLFILITAEVTKGRVLSTLENEPDGYLIKPIAPADLKKRLSLLLDQVGALSDIHIAIDMEDLDRAITLCEQRLESKGSYPIWTRRTLTQLYLKTGQKDKARVHFVEALKQKDFDWARFGLAQLAETPQERQQVIPLLEQLVEEQPNRVEAFDLLAKHHQALDNKKQAKEAMEWALSLSPRSISRQRAVAKANVEAGDFDKAVEAFQKVIKLGDKSVYDTSENYLEFADFLADLSEGELTSKGKQMAKEAVGLLHKANKRFADVPQLSLRTTLMEVRVQAGQNNTEEATTLLEQAQKKIAVGNFDVKQDVTMELARAYYATGQEALADETLNDLMDNHQKDKSLLNRVSDLMDKPVNIKSRMLAAEKNKSGIQLFNKDKIGEAIIAFTEGLSLTPRQPSLNLNLIQLLLKKWKLNNATPAEIKQCQACLDILQGLSKHHREYRRYQHFLKIFTKSSTGRKLT